MPVRLTGRLQHHGAACRQRRTGFAGNHRRREVPRRDGGGNANRLLDNNQALIGLMTGNGVAINAFAFFGKPLNKRGGVADFTFRFGQWFALFEGHQADKRLIVIKQPIGVTAAITPWNFPAAMITVSA